MLRARFRIKEKEETKAGMGMSYALGTQLHTWIQKTAASLLVGVWKCRRCGLRTDADGSLRVPMPKQCPRCLNSKFKYFERKYYDADYLIGGHPDGFRRVVDGDPSEDEVLEFKGLAEYPWKSMEQPWQSWIEQIQTYMWLCKLKRGRVIVFNKNGSGNTPKNWIKEFSIGEDEHELRIIKRRIEVTRTGLRLNVLPRRICTTDKCERAEDCYTKGQCFDTQEGMTDA